MSFLVRTAYFVLVDPDAQRKSLTPVCEGALASTRSNYQKEHALRDFLKEENHFFVPASQVVTRGLRCMEADLVLQKQKQNLLKRRKPFLRACITVRHARPAVYGA